MKTRIRKYCFLVSLMCIGLSSVCYASNEGRGGGDAAILLDDTVVLADSFGVRPGSNPLKADMLFSKELQLELKRVDSIIDSFTRHHPFNTGSIVPDSYISLVRNLIMDSKVRYFLVTEIPGHPECKEKVEYQWLPTNAETMRVACTIQSRTWILKTLFEKMNIRQQALLLVHEGLRRIRPAIIDDEIYRVTDGLSVALDHFNRQMAGRKDVLTPEEGGRYLASIIALFSIKYLYGFTPTWVMDTLWPQLSIHLNGGGLVETGSQIGKDSFLGVGTTVIKGSVVEEGVTVLNSRVCEYMSCFLRSNSTIINSTIWRANVKTEAGARMEGSYVAFHNWGGGTLFLKKGSQLKNVNFTRVYSGENRHLQLSLEENSVLENILSSTFQDNKSLTFVVAANSRIDFKNSFICPDSTNLFENKTSTKTVFAFTIEDFRNLCRNN